MLWALDTFSKPMKTNETPLQPDWPNLSLSAIARHIQKDWSVKVNYAAQPYLEAMATLYSIKDNYGADSGDAIVRYFLCNATTWRGPVARAIKAELNKRLK